MISETAWTMRCTVSAKASPSVANCWNQVIESVMKPVSAARSVPNAGIVRPVSSKMACIPPTAAEMRVAVSVKVSVPTRNESKKFTLAWT